MVRVWFRSISARLDLRSSFGLYRESKLKENGRFLLGWTSSRDFFEDTFEFLESV